MFTSYICKKWSVNCINIFFDIFSFFSFACMSFISFVINPLSNFKSLISLKKKRHNIYHALLT